MAQEIELKLEIDPDNVPLLLGDPILASAPTETADQVTVYYDTPTTALKKHGFTLRVREVDGRFTQTIKPATDSVGLLSREEIECEVSSIAPDLSRFAHHPLSKLLGSDDAGKLRAVIRSDVSRTTVTLDHTGGHIRLDLDRGLITAGERTEEFAELELELLDGSPASLIVSARRLSDHTPVRLGVLTKAERGFRLAAGAARKVIKSGSLHVHGGMTVAEAFELIVHACLKHYRLNEPLVIRDCKAEALHQARVAMRRLRSAFTLFKPAISDVEFHHLRHELRWFTSQLGDARNLDVYLARDLDAATRDRLSQERDRAYDHVADAMNSHRFRRLLIDIVGWTAIGSWRSSKVAGRSISTFANERLDRLWQTIATAGANIADMDESTRHGLRIQGKKMRYATEFLEGLYPESAEEKKAFGKAIGQLQEELGKLNDLATARGLNKDVPGEDWLIGSYDERRHVKHAEEAYRELLSAGPFWRG